ncbi:MAG: class I SAM-dependent methyltransferase [Bacteroidia bacterium]|nr:class I SAM-dependent methyltransferase [Bacteroidia bacterium]
MAHARCVVCDSNTELIYPECSDYFCGAPGKYDYYFCDECKTIQLHPLISEEELIPLYQQYYTETLALPDISTTSSWKSFARRCILSQIGYPADRIERILGFFLSLFPPIREKAYYDLGYCFVPYKSQCRLLEIGCGTGWFLKIMQNHGWEVYGIEPDADAVEIAQKHYGLTKNQVLVGTLSLNELPFPRESFDAIIIRHVIEHVPNPKEVLAKAFQLLRKGGVIALATPNGRSLASRWFGRYWRGLTPPWHLVLYNPTSIRALLKSVGFAKVRVRTRVFPAHWVYTASQ